ncbi:MAG: HU family DNA-binding protein [Desulfovibrionaceae bacterium]|nr:HU family DNA-binding protein [Desulfovibrionaceae bacterium]MBF0515196.1 HU family DNA-binding protein [Desulfovibrionaceae bacterium]
MTKAELISKLAAAAAIKKSEAGLVVEAFTDAVQAALAAGEDVALKGFGAFTVASRKARTGRNPKTGAAIAIAAQKTPKFKPGKVLKDSVN